MDYLKPQTSATSLFTLGTDLLAKLLDELPEAVFVLRRTHTLEGDHLVFVAANRLALERTDLANRFIAGTPLRDYFPQWVERGIDELLFDILKRGKSTSFEDIHYADNVLSVESAVLYKAKPLDSTHLVLVMQDLTELKHVEHDLQQSNTQLTRTLTDLEAVSQQLAVSDEVVNTMQLGLLVLELVKSPEPNDQPQLLIHAANPTAEKRLLRAKPFKPGTPMKDFFPDFGKRGLLELLVEVIESKKPYSFEDIHYQPKALAVAAAFSYKAFPLPNGKCGLIVEDITEVKKAEEETLKVSSELEKALQHLQSAQKQLVLSEKMAALGQLIAGLAHEINTPISAAQVSGRNLMRLLPELLTLWPELEAEVEPSYHRTIRSFVGHILEWNGNLTTAESRQLRKTLEMQLTERGVPDATRLARLLVEVHLEDRVEEVLPLLSLPASEKLLRVSTRLGHIKDNLDSIEVATNKAAGVVKALKNYSYVQQDEHQVKGNLHESLDNVLLLFQNRMKKGVVIVRDYGELPPVPFYADQLPQVWANLIGNALYAMDERGTLTIHTQADATHAQVSITDTGHGIPPELQQRIFEPFFTTKPQGQGTGLGLDVVRKILEKHGGTISLSSRPGKTTFTVTLPLTFQT